jgi:hypothetical protein
MMLNNIDKNVCIDAKDEFTRKYYFSSVSLSPVMSRMVFAGGAFASLLLKENPRDVDLFILNTKNEDYEIFTEFMDVNKWTIDLKISKGNEYIDRNPHIHSVWKCTGKNTNYDIIFTDYITPKEIIDDFDYVHSKIWYFLGKLNLTGSTYKSVMNMKLIPASDKPISEVRKQKFMDRGWKE